MAAINTLSVMKYANFGLRSSIKRLFMKFIEAFQRPDRSFFSICGVAFSIRNQNDFECEVVDTSPLSSSSRYVYFQNMDLTNTPTSWRKQLLRLRVKITFPLSRKSKLLRNFLVSNPFTRWRRKCGGVTVLIFADLTPD